MSGVLWAYSGVVNSQPDNNQEKINPVSHLATIFGADCNLFSTGFRIGIHPSVPRHAMLEEGGVQAAESWQQGKFGIACVPCRAGGWGSQRGTEPREMKQPHVSKDPQTPAPAVPVTHSQAH